MDNSKIFIIIPAYNEEKNIGAVLDKLKPYGYSVAVVDDGSSDRTAAIAALHGVDVLRHRVNRGQGAALETGNQYALASNAEIIVHFDADGQFLAEEIFSVVEPLLDGQADIVFGSRFLGIRSKIPAVKKYLIFPLARLINRLFFDVGLTDPQSGFRAFLASAAQDLAIENDGMAHCSEILAKAYGHSLRIKEVPITVLYTRFGQSFGGGFRILADLLISKLISK